MGGKSRLLTLTFLAALGVASRASAADDCKMLQLGEIPVTMEDLKPITEVKINGQTVRLIADSGAFFSLLGQDQIDRLKLRSGSGGLLVEGVNGEVRARPVDAQEFTVLHHTYKDILFLAAPNYFSARAVGLLGQNFLNVWETEYDLGDGAIRLFKADGCSSVALAYWAKTTPFSVITVDRATERDRAIRGHVSVNGVELTAVFDTGASRSVLSLHGAARAGVKRTDPALKPAGIAGGIGRRLTQTWIAPVQSFKVGDEEVKNTHLRVGEIALNDADMLIGADFFLSHRILVSNSQHKLYLTYNGGPVFNLDVANDQDPSAPSSTPAAASPPAAPVVATGAEPRDADGFVRRAHASASRREYAQSIGDYTRAAALAPKDPQILYARGQTYLADHRPKLALADFDAALHLKPDAADVLMTRAVLHLRQKEMPLAKADFDAAAKLDRKLMPSIGGIYSEEGAYPEAVAELDAWLADPPKGPESAVGFNNRCWARALWNRDLDKALADCDQAVKLAPRNISFLDSRGLVYLRLGRYDDAIRDYSAVVREQPKVAWSLYCRGVAKLKAGKTADGQHDMATAAGIDPAVAARAKRYGLLSETTPAPSTTASR